MYDMLLKTIPVTWESDQIETKGEQLFEQLHVILTSNSSRHVETINDLYVMYETDLCILVYTGVGYLCLKSTAI